MRISIGLTILAAAIALIIILIVGQIILQPDVPLLIDAAFDRDLITPNADGEDDIAIFEYAVSRNALVSITFESEDGTIYTFRDRQRRIENDYRVPFSGVVDGYMLADEDVLGTVERRLIPNGEYTWRIQAEVAETGEIEERTGTFTVQDADLPLPIISSFTVGPTIFTPNQDGIADRVEVNVFLEKPADLRVFLVGEDGQEVPISARKEGRLPGEEGRHIFDYEGGIDLGADPPPDGAYTVVALAQDDEGQRIRREANMTIRDGGKPLAEIVPQSTGVDVVFEVHEYENRFFSTRNDLGDEFPLIDNPASLALTSLTVPMGDLLVFKLTVENYSEVPIRTTGPPPGTVYQQDQLAAALGWVDESGAWRIGIECQTSTTSFPYRWSLGTEDNLVSATDIDNGNTYWYLPPGTRSVVWGAVRLTDIQDRNPQDCWAGLIHEDVEVSLRNNNVGRRSVEIVDTTAGVDE